MDLIFLLSRLTWPQANMGEKLHFIYCDILVSFLILYHLILRSFPLRECHMAHTLEESRAQLIADLQERAEELTELNRIAIALTSEFDLQRLLQMITDAARRVTAAQYAAFFLVPEVVGENTKETNTKEIF